MAELPVSDPLAAYLASVIGRDFGLGRWDCALFCAGWVFHVKQIDPAAAWRGRYRSALGMQRLIKRHGGLIALFDQALVAAGAARTDTPGRGDIAVMETTEGRVGGIVTGRCIAMLAARGLIVRNRSHTQISAAWSI